jgi:hypothetical protein
MRKKLFLIVALLLVMCMPVSKVFAWGHAGSDGSNYAALQETAVFYNNSGAVMSAGEVVVLDPAGTAETTLGSYVTFSSTVDSILVMGVVKAAAAIGSPVIVVTKGPIDTLAADSSDAVTTVTAVGSTGVCKGTAGGGTNLGIALEAGDGTDTGKLFVWVAPTGAD